MLLQFKLYPPSCKEARISHSYLVLVVDVRPSVQEKLRNWSVAFPTGNMKSSVPILYNVYLSNQMIMKEKNRYKIRYFCERILCWAPINERWNMLLNIILNKFLN